MANCLIKNFSIMYQFKQDLAMAYFPDHSNVAPSESRESLLTMPSLSNVISLCRIYNPTLIIIRRCNPFCFIYDDNDQQGRVVTHHYTSIYPQALVF